MRAASFHYRREDLERALRACGLRAGDVVFSHVSMGLLGFPEAGRDERAMFTAIFSAMRRVLGARGTWIVPTYTYSFCRNEPYDPARTPSTVGPFTELFRREPGVLRSREPIFSTAGIGPRAKALSRDLPRDCFGADSLFERLVRADAKICNIGVGFRTITFVHYPEERHNVPYRFLKPFFGAMTVSDRRTRERWLYNVGVRQEACAPDLHALERAARKKGAVKQARVGLGAVTVFSFRDVDRLCAEGIRRDPWFLAAGPKIDLAAAEAKRLGDAPVRVKTSSDPVALARALAGQPAHALSAAYDAALDALGRGLPMNTLSLPSGARVGDAVVPERWLCRAARLTGPDGRAIFSAADHPFHVPYYSAPFSGQVSRAELLRRLRSDPSGIPLRSLYGTQTWGLSAQARTFPAGRYRVEIDAAFGYGMMKLGVIDLPGRTPETIVVFAAADYGGLANDGLSACVAAVFAARELRRGKKLGRGVRFVLAPRGVGPAAFLQSALAPKKIAGLVLLESLGLDLPLRAQAPEESPWAHAAAGALARQTGKRELFLGDGPWLARGDFSLPAVCLSRSARPLHARPYEGFRTSRETFSFVSPQALRDSVAALAGLLEAVAGR